MRVRVIVGVILCLVGVVWFFQGIGVMGGSGMSGEAIWAVFGAVAFAIGASLIRTFLRANRSRS